MVPRPFRVEAAMRCEPDACVQRVRAAVEAVGGWILAITPFSNLALTFDLEIPEGSLADLVEALRGTGAAIATPTEVTTAIRTGTLAVQLVHEQGDRKMTVPAVPG